jgi:hypothetical protein
MGLQLDSWFDDPAYKWFDDPAYKPAQGSFSTKGAFILAKLREHDAAKLSTVLDDM